MAIVWSGSAGYALRWDIDVLQFAMAGALARYHNARGRASIELAGILPYTPLVGRILRHVESGGEVNPVEAPITSIAWNIPDQVGRTPKTTIKTGYA